MKKITNIAKRITYVILFLSDKLYNEIKISDVAINYTDEQGSDTQ